MTRRLLPWMLAVLLTAPLVHLAVLSLSWRWHYPELWPSRFDTGVWQSVMTGEASGLLNALLDSLLIATGVAVAATGLGLWSSLRLAQSRHRRRLLLLALLPFAISPAVLALSLGQGFLRVGLGGSMLGVAAAHWLFAYPYATLLLNALWTERTRALHQLARSLGARPPQLWRRVTWPLGRGLIAVCLLQTFLISWFDFALTRLIGAGQVMTLSMRVFEFFRSGDLRLAAVSALLLMLPPMLVVLLRPHWLLWPSLRESAS